MLIKRAREEQVEHLVVLSQQMGSDRRRKVANAPKEVFVARGRPGGPALLEALPDDLEHVVDIALDLDVDRASNGPERPHD